MRCDAAHRDVLAGVKHVRQDVEAGHERDEPAACVAGRVERGLDALTRVDGASDTPVGVVLARRASADSDDRDPRRDVGGGSVRLTNMT